MDHKKEVMKISKKIIPIIWVIGIVVSMIVFNNGSNKIEFNKALIGILLIWTLSVCFCLEKLKERIFLLFFLLAQFVFLIVRPTIDLMRGKEWWKYWEASELFAVRGLYISIAGLLLGGVIASIFLWKRKDAKSSKLGQAITSYEMKYMKYCIWITGGFFYFTWAMKMVTGVEKILFIQGKNYLDYYSSFQTNLPYVILVFSSMMKYFLCLYLATKPSKIKATIALCMYILSNVPDLLVGVRNPFVLACIFSFLYYFIRDMLGDKEKWIGRKEKIMTIIMIPVGIVALGLSIYVRMGEKVAASEIKRVFVDFFYNQGVSFDVLAIGYGAMPFLPQRAGRNYTFGGIIDYFTHGKIGQLLLHTQPFPDGNCVVNALERNSFAHNMSYIACGKEAYLDGNGMGSSYILETYVDYGYIGVLLFSIVMGILLVYATRWLEKNILIRSVILVALTVLFFVPRAESTGWIEFLLYIQFWIPVVTTFLGAYLLAQFKSRLLEKK